MVLSPLTALADSGYIDNSTTNVPQRAIDEVEWMVNNNKATIRSFSDNSVINNFISCDSDGNIYNLVIHSSSSGATYIYNNVSTDDYELIYFRARSDSGTKFTQFYQWDYTNREWVNIVKANNTNFFYGDDSVQSDLATISSANGSSSYYYCGDYLIWYRADNQTSVSNFITGIFPLASTEYFEGKFEDIQDISHIFISDYIKPFINMIVSDPLLFLICLFGVIVSIVGFVYSFIMLLSSKKSKKLKYRKRG